MSVYAGNSPEKEFARAHHYGSLYRRLGRARFTSRYHIVIASRECGDIHYLLPLGVPKNRIIACDTDKFARMAARKLGVIVSPEPDIEDTIIWAYQQYGNKIASINVDLCGTVLTGAPIVDNVLSHSPRYSDVYFTFMRARDGMRPKKRLAYLTRHICHDTVKDSFDYNSPRAMCMVRF
jgi:hypothetical protein